MKFVVVALIFAAVGFGALFRWKQRVRRTFGAFPDTEARWREAFPDNESDWRWLTACAVRECGIPEEFTRKISPDMSWFRTMAFDGGADSLETVAFHAEIEKHFEIELQSLPENRYAEETFGELLSRILAARSARSGNA